METLGSNWEFDFETDVLSRFLGLAVSSEGKVRVFSGETLGSNWEFDFETDVLSRFLGLAVSSRDNQ